VLNDCAARDYKSIRAWGRNRPRQGVCPGGRRLPASAILSAPRRPAEPFAQRNPFPTGSAASKRRRRSALRQGVSDRVIGASWIAAGCLLAGPLRELVPDDHILRRADQVLDLSWLRDEVRDCYEPGQGRPSIDPETAVRLMPAGLFCGITKDRQLMREAQVNLAIRWFAGYRLHEKLPDHSSLRRIRQRWGPERFRRIFRKSVEACAQAGLIDGETVRVDATLIRADVS
jgi:transposase